MNSRQLLYRMLLLLLLPCIAAVVYIRGQHYEPALIDFKTVSKDISPASATSAQPVEAVAPSLGKDIAGYIQTGRPRVYTKDNLYEHVDGHAEYFISAGFVGLTVTEYKAAGGKSDQVQLQAEVYDMGSSIQAFGVLSDEGGETARPVSIGAMAFSTSAGVNFIKGRYYVKVSALDPKAPLLAFAREFSGTLPAGPDSFDIFSRLPDLGKAGKTRYIKEGYRGLDFLRNVIERDYSSEKGKITLALLSSDAGNVKTLEASLFDYFKKSGMKYEKAEAGGKEFYRVIDKYEGNWLLIPTRDALFAVFGTEDETVVHKVSKNQ